MLFIMFVVASKIYLPCLHCHVEENKKSNFLFLNIFLLMMYNSIILACIISQDHGCQSQAKAFLSCYGSESSIARVLVCQPVYVG